jgi:glucose-6-phosphate isomerase
MNNMNPFTSELFLPEGLISPAHNHYVRKLSDMKGQFLNRNAVDLILSKEDIPLYEVYENQLPNKPGELQFGTSIVYPGKIGDEYFMTKGHFHSVLETAEVYYCLRGHGYMMMETPEGEWSVEELTPGVVLYVPPTWAHRSINVGNEKLITFFVYPGDAGHDYGTIEVKGFRKLLVEKDQKPTVIDNPKWQN